MLQVYVLSIHVRDNLWLNEALISNKLLPF